MTINTRFQKYIEQVKKTPEVLRFAYAFGFKALVVPKLASKVETFGAMLAQQIRRINGSAQPLKFYLRLGEVEIANISTLQNQDKKQLLSHFKFLQSLDAESAHHFELFLWAVLSNFQSSTVASIVNSAIEHRLATMEQNKTTTTESADGKANG